MNQTIMEHRDELIAEISYRMKGSEEMTKMLHAMEIEKQPHSALKQWLNFLRQAKISGNGKG